MNRDRANAEMLQTLIQGQQAIRDNLADLKKRLGAAEKSVACFSTRMSKVETNAREIARKVDSFETPNNYVEQIQQTLVLQPEKLTELQDRSRMSNVVVFGIDEGANEMEDVLRQTIIKEVFECTA